MRLIYANDVKTRADHYPPDIRNTIANILRHTKTIDAVEVVRCKDCKYSVDYYQDGSCYCRRPSKPMELIENGFNWFCADGKLDAKGKNE